MKTTMKSKILFIALIGVILTTHTQTKIGFDINDAFTVSGNSVAHYGMSRISGNDYHYVGLSGFFGLNFYTNGKERIKVNRDGYVGIGTTSPQGNLHVSSGTSGDAILKLEADSDNNNEYDNPMIQIRQDAGQVGVNMGFSEENFGANVFGIGTRYLSQEKWDVFAINTKTGNVGIGTTSSPQEKLQIGNSGFTFHDGGHKVLTFNPNTTNYGAIRYDVQNKRFSIETVIDGNYKSHMLLNSKGNVAIYGKLESKEVKVTLTPTADFVFEKNYNLPTLDFIEKYIKEKKHLPEIASAKEMKQNGVNIGEFQIQLLQKIEELTLYTIQQQKDLEAQQEQLEVQQKQNRTTETRLKALEALLQAD
tara:strand:+ start:464 stop:1552 length:1089 start_codon:yes stop_codon:yes gene_type:complete